MYTLERTYTAMFKEYYVGYNPKTNIRVHCILDDSCVRYRVEVVGSQRVPKSGLHEFKDTQKKLCFSNALRRLNRM